MHHPAHTKVAATAATALLIAVAASSSAAAAPDPDAVYADITVALDIPSSGTGPMVFSAQDIPVGDGPELTGADEISNPSDWCGDIAVDIDLGLGALVVTGGDSPCDFTTVDMTVELSGAYQLDYASVLLDTLIPMEDVALETLLEDGVLTASWATPPSDDLPFMNGATFFMLDEAGPFEDVSQALGTTGYNEHWKAITWMGFAGISTGYSSPQGTLYRPFASTTRDALAAFIYRMAGSPDVILTDEAAPFVDVSSTPGDPHYSEHWEAIYWMAQEELSGGWHTDEGPEYRPTAKVSRDAIAAFLFRLYGPSEGEPGLYDDPFDDVSSDPEADTYSEHAEAIAWLHSNKLSQGFPTASGRDYRPTSPITRDAIAAFLFRTTQWAQFDRTGGPGPV